MGIVVNKEKKEEDKTENKPFWTTLFDTPRLRLRKSIFDFLNESEEDTAESYNVAVYKVLPYPPNTKHVKDFFIERT